MWTFKMDKIWIANIVTLFSCLLRMWKIEKMAGYILSQAKIYKTRNFFWENEMLCLFTCNLRCSQISSTKAPIIYHVTWNREYVLNIQIWFSWIYIYKFSVTQPSSRNHSHRLNRSYWLTNQKCTKKKTIIALT